MKRCSPWGSRRHERYLCGRFGTKIQKSAFRALFLLPLLAQDEHESWLVDTASARKRVEDEAAQTPEGSNATGPSGDDASVVDRPSPLALPLTVPLENLRAERRASMSHSTRIQVEALTGDRELKLEDVRSAVSQADARRGGGDASAAALIDDTTARASSPSLAVAMKNLEAECTALPVVDWAANALFSFSGELRAPDARWTTACLQLEKQIAGWVTRMREALPAAPNSRSRGSQAKRDGNGARSLVASAMPPAEGDTVWEALETFQRETGDAVDDRHCSAEVITKEIDSEAKQKMHFWVGDIENAAADLCVAERTSYLETVETLRTLDHLFGLEEDRASTSIDRIREATRAAADALAKGLSPTPDDHALAREGGCLQEEVRRAVQDVYHQDRLTLSGHETRHDVAADSLVGGRNQRALFPSEGLGGTEEGTGLTGRSSDSAGALGVPTSREAEPSVDAGTNGEGERDRESAALTTAIWRCRLTYICRLSGIVMRLVRAVRGCEAKISSMRAASRRLKRRRVQLEHEGFSVAASMIRRALEECDHAIIEDILENGIPVGRRLLC